MPKKATNPRPWRVWKPNTPFQEIRYDILTPKGEHPSMLLSNHGIAYSDGPHGDFQMLEGYRFRRSMDQHRRYGNYRCRIAPKFRVGDTVTQALYGEAVIVRIENMSDRPGLHMASYWTRYLLYPKEIPEGYLPRKENRPWFFERDLVLVSRPSTARCQSGSWWVEDSVTAFRCYDPDINRARDAVAFAKKVAYQTEAVRIPDGLKFVEFRASAALENADGRYVVELPVSNTPEPKHELLARLIRHYNHAQRQKQESQKTLVSGASAPQQI